MRVRIVFILILIFILSVDVQAQCSMCSAAAEQATGQNGIGKGINSGIAFLAITVYSVLGFIGYLFYRNYKRTGRDRDKNLSN